MSGVIDTIERSQLRRVPRFQAGDRLRVHFQVVEGTRKRTQVFEGVVIKRQGNGARETFTVRKQSFGVGVERTFPVHSPKIEQIEVAARGDVRRAKLYYLRDRIGRSARVRERRFGPEDEMDVMPPEIETPEAAPEADGAPEVADVPDTGVEEATEVTEVAEAAADEGAEPTAAPDEPVGDESVADEAPEASADADESAAQSDA